MSKVSNIKKSDLKKFSFENDSFKFIFAVGSLLIVGSWILFGLLWHFIAVNRSIRYFNNNNNNNNNTNQQVGSCLEEVPNIVEALIFSVESQTTIGYGTRVIDPNCFDTLFILMVQLIVGCFIDTITTGMFSQKLLKKINEKNILKFNKFVKIKKSKNGEYVLEFKMLRLTRENLSKVKIAATVTHCEDEDNGDDDDDDDDNDFDTPVLSKLTDSFKTQMNFRKYNLPLSYDENCSSVDYDFILFQWPVSLYHKIDEHSSLWKLRHKLEEASTSIAIHLTIECFVGHSGIPHKSSVSFSGNDFVRSDEESVIILTKNDDDDLFSFHDEF